MDVKVLFNGTSLRDDLSIGWGVSFLIDKKILFDTGEKGDLLAHNINSLDVDLAAIESLVISHDHWDHTGGLWDILKQRPHINVYGCAGFSDEFKEKVKSGGGRLIEPKGFAEIAEHVYLTKELKCEYKEEIISEQAMVVATENGLTVITGCAHPGILEILESVRKEFRDKRLHAVFGGFHLMNKDRRAIELLVREFRRIGIQKAGPTHCSGPEAEKIFRHAYKDDFFSLKVGENLDM